AMLFIGAASRLQSPHRPRTPKRPSVCAATRQHLCRRCRNTDVSPKIRVTRGYNMARVLIIDDDVTLRQALTKHLEHAGHDVRQAPDGDAGVRAYQRHAADVVIVDIFMPVQGGLQTIGRLRREWPAVKILAMSGVKSAGALDVRSEEHTSELQSPYDVVCRLRLEKKTLRACRCQTIHATLDLRT